MLRQCEGQRALFSQSARFSPRRRVFRLRILTSRKSPSSARKAAGRAPSSRLWSVESQALVECRFGRARCMSCRCLCSYMFCPERGAACKCALPLRREHASRPLTRRNGTASPPPGRKGLPPARHGDLHPAPARPAARVHPRPAGAPRGVGGVPPPSGGDLHGLRAHPHGDPGERAAGVPQPAGCCCVPHLAWTARPLAGGACWVTSRPGRAQAETDRVTGTNKGVSEKQIRLKICSPYVLTMTVRPAAPLSPVAPRSSLTFLAPRLPAAPPPLRRTPTPSLTPQPPRATARGPPRHRPRARGRPARGH